MKLLVISFAFAPDREIGAKRITRFSSYLPEYGIQPIVITVLEQYLTHRDDSFCAPPGVRVVRTGMWRNPLYWYADLKKRIAPPRSLGSNSSTEFSAQPTRTGRRSFFLRQLLTLLNTPDRFGGWYLPAIKAAERLINSEDIAVILSSGPPWTTHLVARHLRQKYGIPWAADFRDGWATNPNLDGGPRWAQKLNARLERSCLRSADLVICNTEALRKSFIERNPRLQSEKFTVLTNGFDDLGPPLIPAAASKRLLLHFGSIYGRRRIDTFCKAVSDLVKAGQLHPSSFKILFHGEIDRALLAAVHQRTPELLRNRCIEFEYFINSWEQALEFLWAADLLLLFAGSTLEVPAKFYEYLKTGKPIFAVAERGALTELIDSTGSGIWADPADPGQIAAGLLRALQLPAIPPEEAERRWSNRFHFRSLTAQLARLIRQLASQNSAGARSAHT